jgi:octaprenyl-diphosphate synthase
LNAGGKNIKANPLVAQFNNYISKIEEALIRELDLYSWSEFYSPLRYACEGGKRIRPLLLVLSVEAIQTTNRDSCHVTDDAFMAGSAIELLHTESVIHDDIIDEERLRRGKPSFHIKYGYNSSILTADFVLGIILNIGSKMSNRRVINELSSAATKMSEGEMMEIRLAKHNDVTEDEYIKVIEHKTASLFEASTKLGAILGDGNEDQIHALGTFGNLLGIAYQIHDDLLDWNNEDRLFNLLVKQNVQSMEFVDNMDRLYKSYSSRALNELRKVGDSVSTRHLQLLTDLSSVQF